MHAKHQSCARHWALDYTLASDCGQTLPGVLTRIVSAGSDQASQALDNAIRPLSVAACWRPELLTRAFSHVTVRARHSKLSQPNDGCATCAAEPTNAALSNASVRYMSCLLLREVTLHAVVLLSCRGGTKDANVSRQDKQDQFEYQQER